MCKECLMEKYFINNPSSYKRNSFEYYILRNIKEETRKAVLTELLVFKDEIVEVLEAGKKALYSTKEREEDYWSNTRA